MSGLSNWCSKRQIVVIRIHLARNQPTGGIKMDLHNYRVILPELANRLTWLIILFGSLEIIDLVILYFLSLFVCQWVTSLGVSWGSGFWKCKLLLLEQKLRWDQWKMWRNGYCNKRLFLCNPQSKVVSFSIAAESKKKSNISFWKFVLMFPAKGQVRVLRWIFRLSALESEKYATDGKRINDKSTAATCWTMSILIWNVGLRHTHTSTHTQSNKQRRKNKLKLIVMVFSCFPHFYRNLLKLRRKMFGDSTDVINALEKSIAGFTKNE